MLNTTIYEIAEKAGVSTSTVSRVINNYPYIKKETREKVQKILKEYKYIPNDTARSLVNKSSRMIGVLISDIRTTHYTEGVYYIQQEFSEKGYSCLIYNTGTDPEKQASYIQLLRQRKVEAVILIGSIYQNDAVQNAINETIPNIPVVLCNGMLSGDNIYNIITDERSGVCEAVRILTEKGRRHLFFINNHITPSNTMKAEGFMEGIRKYCSDGTGNVIISGDSIDEIAVATKNLLSSHPETDGIIFSEDFMALVGLHTLYELSISVPDQVAVFGLNNSSYAKFSIPPLSSIDNMLYDTSMLAVRSILDVLDGKRVTKTIKIEPEIVERKTT